MKNGIVTKLTSLILMTIMVAGGVTFAFPGVVPAAEAAHNANLFVSAENAAFDNFFNGPMVIEVVVNDPTISDTDEAKGEPDVTVNGKDLRMVQTTDGKWYGYFAELGQAQLADDTVALRGFAGFGLDFGKFCSNAPANGLLQNDDSEAVVDVSQTEGITIPRQSQAADATDGQTALVACAAGTADRAGIVAATALDNHVVREFKAINPGSNNFPQTPVTSGQINIDVDAWPLIQLFTFDPTGSVVVQYNKGGGPQTTTLTFDTVQTFAGLTFDRGIYPLNAQVHVEVTDVMLNIDPTDEDSWTFDTDVGGTEIRYQVFNENGEQDGACVIANNTTPAVAACDSDGESNLDSVGRDGTTDLSTEMASNGPFACESNCVLIFDLNPQNAAVNILVLQDNADQIFDVVNDPDNSGDALDQPVTLTETLPNSGIFTTYDDSDTSNVRTVDVLPADSNTVRNRSGTLNYNEVPQTVLLGFGFADIDIQPVDDVWNSGEEIPIILVDSDANKNSRVDEDLDVNNPDVQLIPTLTIGAPFTLNGVANTASFYDSVRINDSTATATTLLDIANTEFNLITETTTTNNFAQRLILDPITDDVDLDLSDVADAGNQDTNSVLVIDLGGRTVADLKAVVRQPLPGGDAGEFRGFNIFAWDIRSINDNAVAADPDLPRVNINTTDIYLIVDTDGVAGFASASLEDTPQNDNLELIRIARDQPLRSFVALNTVHDNDASGAAFADELYDNTNTGTAIVDADEIGLLFFLNTGDTDFIILANAGGNMPITADFMSFGLIGDGLTAGQRINDQITRLELEETGDNTGTFGGSLEFLMLNQLNVFNVATYTGSAFAPLADDPVFIVQEDLTDEDSPRVSYDDLGADGVVTPVGDQEEAPTTSGIADLNADIYKIADTVEVTITDQDLNTDADLINIFTTVSSIVGGDADRNFDQVGDLFATSFDVIMNITFDDELWIRAAGIDSNGDADFTDAGDAAVCAAGTAGDDGLGSTGFTLVETGKGTGIFKGDFQVPGEYCSRNNSNTIITTVGTDMEVNYQDFRDGSGEVIEVGDGAGIRGNTGSISLDRTVFPVPFGVPGDFAGQAASTTPNGRSIFPIHLTSIAAPLDGLGAEFLNAGDLTIHVRVSDPDLDLNPMGSDTLAGLRTIAAADCDGVNNDAGSGVDDTAGANNICSADGFAEVGLIKLSVTRGTDEVVLAYAGRTSDANLTTSLTQAGADKVIDVGADDPEDTLQSGAIAETAPDSGVFELDFVIRYTDGPDDARCPITGTFTGTGGAPDGNELTRFDTASAAGQNYCIIQGDIITVEYEDQTDASGSINTITDSAAFDLRNGVLQSDKSVYIIGGDMILTLIEPDLDLESDAAETYDIDLIEWDSDAATVTLGDLGGNQGRFDSEPLDFRETGDSTGIFQIVVEIPQALSQSGAALDNIERGEQIVLEYTDWGPSGANFVGNEDEDINLTIYSSNFGATVELDQKVYSWTDKVFITVVAPDHNFDSNLIDEIGNTQADKLVVQTRGFDIERYRLEETGADTGIFTGEVIMTGFCHDADGKLSTGAGAGETCPQGSDTNPRTSADDTGPVNGFIQNDDDDGFSVSFEFSEDEVVVGSALIRWNIGEVNFLEASYPATGQGVIRVVDPDMNLNPESVDNFDVDIWSDSDAGGIDLTVTETNEATGIFEGTVFFTVDDESSGHRLRVAEGDTVTAEYEDNTLPDPYTTADELDITSTILIGTVVPPLERAPASNPAVVDAFGNALTSVSVDQQVQITADLANGQDREQPFAYLVQIQDGNGVTVSLSWITGTLAAGQSFTPAQSWTPDSSGTYTVQIFVWESVDNPTALSPPVTTSVTVS